MTVAEHARLQGFSRMSKKKNESDNRLAEGLSEVLKARRVQLGLSQSEVGSRAGLHRTYVSEVERGAQNITIETLWRLAEALETTVLLLIEDATIAIRASDPIEVLLIEDNAADIHMVKRTLQASKISSNLTVLSDGKDALDYLNRKGAYADAKAPDLILLDLHLPRKNGYEILKEIRGDNRLKPIPVVILTNSETDTDITKSYEMHANTFITKPLNQKQFQDAISHVLEYWFGVASLPPT